jgi:hypothetical protein
MFESDHQGYFSGNLIADLWSLHVIAWTEQFLWGSVSTSAGPTPSPEEFRQFQATQSAQFFNPESGSLDDPIRFQKKWCIKLVALTYKCWRVTDSFCRWLVFSLPRYCPSLSKQLLPCVVEPCSQVAKKLLLEDGHLRFFFTLWRPQVAEVCGGRAQNGF